MIPFSLLDLAPIAEGGNATTALHNALDLARHAEGWGYTRYWLAEHHNMPGIASAATAVVIGHVAGGTSTIRVGAGGVMLPNHSPLVIAEQFGTLEALYPGRIDLGLGRAPGSDQVTARALRRHLGDEIDTFPRDVVELMGYFGPSRPDQPVRAVPGTGLQVPVWILGSSLYGAQLAAMLGLPYAFASHFAPEQMMPAIQIYRERFQPSAQLAVPHVMLGFNIFAADSDAEAEFLYTSQQQAFANLRRGRPGLLPPPVRDIDALLSPVERANVDHAMACRAVGSPDTVRRGLAEFIERTGADEVMIAGNMFDHTARLHSFEIAAMAASMNREEPMGKKVVKSEAEWRAQLTPEQYRVTRQKGTERPFSGEYERVWTSGVYHCVGCGQELFESDTKFDAGCGWPSFTDAISNEAIQSVVDNSHGMRRTEVLCAACDSHLGHVFPDGPGASGLRYCINSVAIKLDPK